VSLSTGWIALNDGLKNLRVLWDDTKAEWDDAVRLDFEEHHWAPLEVQIVATLRAMDRLGPILARAQRECS
jgi:hypothetical protein